MAVMIAPSLCSQRILRKETVVVHTTDRRIRCEQRLQQGRGSIYE